MVSAELVFAPGETEKTAIVFLGQGSYGERDEVFLVMLSAPKGATIAEGEGLIAITDDD